MHQERALVASLVVAIDDTLKKMSSHHYNKNEQLISKKNDGFFALILFYTMNVFEVFRKIFSTLSEFTNTYHGHEDLNHHENEVKEE